MNLLRVESYNIPPDYGRDIFFLSIFLTSGQIVTGNTKVFVCTGDGTIRTFKEEGGGSVPVKDKDFTYTGNCEVIDDSTEMGVNWRIKFLTSGVLTLKDERLVDVFLVGGGGNGGTSNY